MEVSDRGFSFKTQHSEDPANPNLANVDATYRRTQTQAAIRRTQPFELEFFGRGLGMELGVRATPRRATPQALVSLNRAATGNIAPTLRASVSAAVTARATTASVASAAPAVIAPSRSTNVPTPVGAAPRGPVVEAIPLDTRPNTGGIGTTGGINDGGFGGGGGGGGGGAQNTFHSSVLIELFIFGADQPVQTWFLDQGMGPEERRVKFEIEGFPSPNSLLFRTGWWRMVVRPVSEPVDISIAAYVRIANVPIRTTPIGVRLANHLFRVALEALTPQAGVVNNRLEVSIGPEIAELAGVTPKIFSKGISPLESDARLRSLAISSISGKELHQIALSHMRKRAGSDAAVAFRFGGGLGRLPQVQDDDVCIRIQAAFSNASVSAYGFDVASLRGELGEFILAFDHNLQSMRGFSFLDVDFSDLAEFALDVARVFTEVPESVNEVVEEMLNDFPVQQQVCGYLKGVLTRAVGQRSTVYNFKFHNNAWQVRHSDDPIIPRPGDVTLPPVGNGPADGGVIALFARANIFRDAEIDAAPTTATSSAALAAPAPAAAPLPAGFLPPGAQLALLDKHKCIVVVMMENRSYDHLLGDLMNARPQPDPYDGAPGGIQNVGTAGFILGVPVVHTREINLGTAIPVSPAHDFVSVSFQIGDGSEAGRSSGDMMGFAADLHNRTDSPQLALTVYGQQELPIHYALADEFCVCDRWFAAHPGPTFPNRFATIMGRIPELENFENDDPRIGFLKDRNIFDLLTAAGIEWRVFESDLSLVRMFNRYRLDDTRVLPIDDPQVGLEATLRKPDVLPRVMFVEPNFADIPPLSTASDDHPPADLKGGQAFLARVCDLLWDTGRFQDILFVITYDEHGGFYDHVPPPGTPKGVQQTFAPLIEGGPTHLGVRVPTFVVSPHVEAHQVNRTIFDHTSILKTILVHNRDRLSSDQLQSFGQRVNEANDLSAVLKNIPPRQTPLAFVRRKFPSQTLTFGNRVILDNLLDIVSTFETTPNAPPDTATPGAGSTPREIKYADRVASPGGRQELRDYHAALTGMLQPKRSG